MQWCRQCFSHTVRQALRRQRRLLASDACSYACATYTFADSAEIPSALRPLALTNAATPLSATLLTAFFGIDSVPSVVG